MKCPYSDKCCDSGTPRCAMCMHNEERSYYVEYHEYPADKWLNVPYEGNGDDLRSPIRDDPDWIAWPDEFLG